MAAAGAVLLVRIVLNKRRVVRVCLMVSSFVNSWLLVLVEHRLQQTLRLNVAAAGVALLVRIVLNKRRVVRVWI